MSRRIKTEPSTFEFCENKMCESDGYESHTAECHRHTIKFWRHHVLTHFVLPPANFPWLQATNQTWGVPLNWNVPSTTARNVGWQRRGVNSRTHKTEWKFALAHDNVEHQSERRLSMRETRGDGEPTFFLIIITKFAVSLGSGLCSYLSALSMRHSGWMTISFLVFLLASAAFRSHTSFHSCRGIQAPFPHTPRAGQWTSSAIH